MIDVRDYREIPNKTGIHAAVDLRGSPELSHSEHCFLLVFVAFHVL
jgi:hypothetical protein